MKIAIVANGEWDQEWGKVELSSYEMIIAADGGGKHVIESGHFPDALIGDLDSIEPEILELCRQKGIPIVSYPSQKDETDLELACMYGVEIWQKAKEGKTKEQENRKNSESLLPEIESSHEDSREGSRFEVESSQPEITLLGGTGGRIDHLLGNLSLLLKFFYQGYPIKMKDPQHDIYLVDGEKIIEGFPGQTLSLIPVSPKAKVSTEGFYYPLYGEYLYQENPRGISNVLEGKEGKIKVSEGIVLVIQLEIYKI
ncbi:MAG: thiamine diphosphokinase [Desulfitobacterium sp.]|nr:thiamine diphosphokinase [Desulfitobacterium sp.]